MEESSKNLSTDEDKPNDCNSSDAEHSTEPAATSDEDKVDCESGQNDTDESGLNQDCKNSEPGNGETKSNHGDDLDKDLGDEKPLELTIDHGNNSGEETSEGGDKRSSEERHLVKSPRSIVRSDYASGNGNGHGVDDELGENNSHKVKQEIDIDEEPIMLNANGEMDDYPEQDDMNGDNEDYDGMGKGKLQ